MNDLVENLIDRLKIEFEKKDKSGVYGETQRMLAYNSNRIEGSTLTYNQTAFIFDTNSISFSENELIKTKDIEEMTGHFLMFNNMLKSYDVLLTEDLIKSYHYDLKSGVFEDKANGYPIGEYKNRANRVSDIVTVKPEDVHLEMEKLIDEYNNKKNVTLEDIALFHSKYESIHPFQDGNGRTSRIIIYKECLKNNIFPLIIEDVNKSEYYASLNSAQKGDVLPLVEFFKKEQLEYYNRVKDLL